MVAYLTHGDAELLGSLLNVELLNYYLAVLARGGHLTSLQRHLLASLLARHIHLACQEPEPRLAARFLHCYNGTFNASNGLGTVESHLTTVKDHSLHIDPDDSRNHFDVADFPFVRRHSESGLWPDGERCPVSQSQYSLGIYTSLNHVAIVDDSVKLGTLEGIIVFIARLYGHVTRYVFEPYAAVPVHRRRLFFDACV